jgi:hypothetical protein
MIKINSSYKYLLFFFALIALISFSEISNSAPATNVTRNNAACTAPITLDLFACETQPTTQNIIFHKVAFCTALPTEPTSTTATGMTNCSTVFENTAGATVSIQKGIGTTPNGTFTDPPYGNYTFAYVELSPVFTYKTNLVFNGVTAFSSDATGTGGANCQTNGLEDYNHLYGGVLEHGGITCQVGVGVATDTNITLNSLDSERELYAGRFAGTNGNIDVYLIKTDGTLANGSELNLNLNVAKVIAFVPITVKITPDTSSYNLLYNNTRGMTVFKLRHDARGGFDIGFGIPYFDMTFQVQ